MSEAVAGIVPVLIGPTASGKTDLSIALAQDYSLEIVNQDSRQVYRYMDIGTAKPTPEQLAAVPHHGIDVVNPDQTWTLAQQLRLTYRAIEDIRSRGRLPMLVGGTGQYIRAIVEGWNVPEVSPNEQLRADLYEEAGRVGAPELHARLAAIDPASAERIMPNDLRRIVRALEVYYESGRPISEWQVPEGPRYPYLVIGLYLDRQTLYERIDARAHLQLRSGLLEEIERLLAMGYDWSLSSMKTIGYWEFRPYFESTATIEECTERLLFDTHAFARRQLIWFRRLPEVAWIPPDLYELRALLSRALADTSGAG